MTDDRAEVRVNDVGDILWIQFEPVVKSAYCRTFGDSLNVDYDSEGRVVGVELIGLPGGVSLRGLPEADRVRAVLRAHGPPGLRIENDLVYLAPGGPARPGS